MARLNIALLAEGEEPIVDTPAPESEVVVDEIVQSPEPEIAESTEIAAELDEIDAAMDEGVETAEVLDNIADKVEESQADGGLPPVAAEAIAIAVSHLRKRVGLPPKRNGFALEQFKSKTTRSQATKIALEGIAETIKTIWDSVIAGVSAAIEAVKRFFANLFNGAEKLRVRAEKLEKAANEKSGKEAAAGAKIKSAGWGKMLQIGGKIPGGGELPGLYDKQVNGIYLKAMDLVGEKAAEKMGASVGKVIDAVADEKGFTSALAGLNFPSGTKKSSRKIEGLPEGMEVTEMETLLGDRTIFVIGFSTAVKPEQMAAGASRVKIFVDSLDDRKEVGDEEVVPMSAAGALQVAEAVKKHMASYAGLKADMGKIEGMLKELQGKAKSASKGVKEGAETAAKNAKIASGLVKSMSAISANGLASMRNYDIGVGSAALNFAAASLQVIGKEAPKDVGAKK